MEPAVISLVAPPPEGTVVFAPTVLEVHQTARRLHKSLDEYRALRKALFSLLTETKTDPGRPWRISYSRDPSKGDRTVPVKIRHHTTTGAIVINGQAFNGIAKIAEPETYAPFHDLKFFDSDNNPPAAESLIAANQRKMVFVLSDLLACVKVIARGLPELQREARQLRLTTEIENLARFDESLPVFPYWPDNMREMTKEQLDAVLDAEAPLLSDLRLTLSQLADEAEHRARELLHTATALAQQIKTLADGLQAGLIKEEWGAALVGSLVAEAARLGALNSAFLSSLRDKVTPLNDALTLANTAADWLIENGLMPALPGTPEGDIRAIGHAFEQAAILAKGQSMAATFYLAAIGRDQLETVAEAGIALVAGIRRHIRTASGANECSGPGKVELTETALRLERAINPDKLPFDNPRRRAIKPAGWPTAVWTDLRDIRIHFDNVMTVFKWQDLCDGPNKLRNYEPIPLTAVWEWPNEKIDANDLRKIDEASRRLKESLPARPQKRPPTETHGLEESWPDASDNDISAAEKKSGDGPFMSEKFTAQSPPPAPAVIDACNRLEKAIGDALLPPTAEPNELKETTSLRLTLKISSYLRAFTEAVPVIGSAIESGIEGETNELREQRLRRKKDWLASFKEAVCSTACSGPIGINIDGRDAKAAEDFVRHLAEIDAHARACMLTRANSGPTPTPAAHHARTVSPAPARPAASQDLQVTNTFRRVGEYWDIRFGSESGHFEDLKGFAILHTILHSPNPTRPLSAIELGNLPSEAALETGSAEVSDAEALREYHDESSRLRQEIADANANGDIPKAETLTTELEAVLSEIKASKGLGGSRRALGPVNAAKSAQVRVGKNVSDAIKRMSESMPKLCSHLKSYLKTGKECAYRPPTPAPHWQFD